MDEEEDSIILVCERCAEVFEDELSNTEYECIEGKKCEFCGRLIKQY